jgi:hypothetical protein
MEADQDKDGKISFDEFKKMVENTDVSMSMTLGKLRIFRTLAHPGIFRYCLSWDTLHRRKAYLSTFIALGNVFLSCRMLAILCLYATFSSDSGYSHLDAF